MGDLELELELEAMLRDRADRDDGSVVVPSGLELEVGRARRALRRRRLTVAGAMTFAAAAIAAVVAIGALSTTATKNGVNVVAPTTIARRSVSEKPAVIPSGTDLLGIDDTGHVVALNSGGAKLATLLSLPVATAAVDRAQLMLEPDDRALWTVAPLGSSNPSCREAVEHDLARGRAGRVIDGTWFGLSTDGTMLAYGDCREHAVRVRDLGTNREWSAPSPFGSEWLRFLAISPDDRTVLAQYHTNDSFPSFEMHLSDVPGPTSLGEPLSIADTVWIGTTPSQLYAVPIDVFDGRVTDGVTHEVIVLDWAFRSASIDAVPDGLVPANVITGVDNEWALARPSPDLTLPGLFRLDGGGVRTRTDIVAVTTVTSPTGRARTGSAPTLPESGRGVTLPANTAMLGLDESTGDVVSLDANGETLTTLFKVPLLTYSRNPFREPMISQLHVSPDRRTMWYEYSYAPADGRYRPA